MTYFFHISTYLLIVVADYVLVWACWPNFIFYLVGNANNYELLCSTTMPLVEQELLTLPKHLHSPPVFSEIPVTRSLVLYVYFVDSCFSFCTFSIDHCVVCPSSIYGFWLLLWYLQTLLLRKCSEVVHTKSDIYAFIHLKYR